jgi:endonuclease YncB( thermonuclease family)
MNGELLGERRTTMKKRFLILFVVCLSAWLLTDQVSAQSYKRISEKNVKVVKGKTLVLKGAVRDGDEVLYRFRARAGQRITVRILGRDAEFSVYLNYGLDVESVAQDTKSWSGKMPPEFNGHCEIGVHSTYKLADYRLEISLK